MPHVIIKTECASCGKLKPSTQRWCDACRPMKNTLNWNARKQRRMEQFGGKDPYGQTRYLRVRTQAIKRDQALCQICLQKKRYTPFECVHHIKEAHTHPELFYTLDNLLALCNDCHKEIHDQQQNNL